MQDKIMQNKIMKNKIWNRNFIKIFTASVLLLAGNQMIMTVLPLFMDEIGCAASVLGTATSISALAAMAARPVAGRIADKKSKRLVMGLGLSVMSLGMMGFSALPFAAAILAIRFLQGFGISAATTAQVAIAADTLPGERVEEGLSYFGIGNTVAAALGPSLGLALIFGKNYLPSWMTGAGMFLAAMLLVWALPAERRGAKAPEPPDPKERTQEKGFWNYFEKSAALPSLIWMILMVADAGTIVFLPTYAAQMGVRDIGLFYAFQAATMFITTLAVGNLMHRLDNPEVLLVPSLLIYCGFPLLLFLAHGLGLLLLAGVVYGVGLGATTALVRALSLSRASLKRRGAASATFQCAQDLGYCVGSFAGGIVANAYGYRTLNGILVLFPAVALLISLAALRRRDG